MQKSGTYEGKKNYPKKSLTPFLHLAIQIVYLHWSQDCKLQFITKKSSVAPLKTHISCPLLELVFGSFSFSFHFGIYTKPLLYTLLFSVNIK